MFFTPCSPPVNKLVFLIYIIKLDSSGCIAALIQLKLPPSHSLDLFTRRRLVFNLGPASHLFCREDEEELGEFFLLPRARCTARCAPLLSVDFTGGSDTPPASRCGFFKRRQGFNHTEGTCIPGSAHGCGNFSGNQQ